MMMRACQIAKQGVAASELKVTTIAKPTIGSDSILVRNSVAGVNFIDTYFRSGLYPVQLPFIFGQEGVGVVEEVGPNANLQGFGASISKPSDLIGKRVAYSGSAAYAEFTEVNPSRSVIVPNEISDEVAAASIIQGLTAHYLVNSINPLTPGKTCLVHACAGGTGQLVCQLAKANGATVIGTCSTKKVGLVEKLTNGSVDHVIDYSTADVPSEVRKIVPNGVDLVLDGVGKSTYQQSLDSVAPRGYVCFFGNASGPVPPIDPLVLSRKGSIFITRPTLFNYIATDSEFQERIQGVMKAIQSKQLVINIDRTFALENASKAQEYIESGASTGKIVLKI